MTEIISKDEKITSDNSQESQKILPSQFKFSLFKLAYTAELAAEYKKQRIKFSAAVIYDVAPFLALIFKSLTDNKINFEDGFVFSIDCDKYAKILYRGEYENKTSKTNISKNLYKVMELLNKENRHLIHFELKQGSNCKVQINKGFKEYIEKNILIKDGNCLRIIPRVREILSKLRRSQRAYVYFCEELFFRLETNYHSKDSFEINRNKKNRILSFFSNKSSTHDCTLTEIKKAAYKAFNDHYIDFEEVITTLQQELASYKNQKGISSDDQFQKVPSVIKQITEAGLDGANNEDVLNILRKNQLSEKQIEFIFNNSILKVTDYEKTRIDC